MTENKSVVALRFMLQAEARRLLPSHRVGQCLRSIVPGTPLVEVWRSYRHRKAHYRNLRTCSCVWVCPLCASRISEERRIEIGKVIKHYEKNGYHTSLCLFTMPHNAGDAFNVTVTELMSCYAAMTSGRGWQGIKDAYSIHGWCRALEFTHGANGWHPHLHVLLWTLESDTGELMREMSNRWIQILDTIGRSGKVGVAFNLLDATADVEKYVAKFGYCPEWRVEHEVGKAVVKKAKPGHRNPGQLLYDSAHGDKRAGGLWRQYAENTKGRRQLEWSRNPSPKTLAGVTELSDEEIMAKHDESATLLATLNATQWHNVLRVGGVGTLLELAAGDNLWEFANWIFDVTGKNILNKED